MVENRYAILDSGERTQFNTGAVRDMHEGKGRMDLLPMTALIELSKHCENGAKKYGEPHPQIKEVALPLLKELSEEIPVVFDDLMEGIE